MGSEEGPLDLKTLVLEPNNCPLDAGVSLKLTFVSSIDISDAVWMIKVQVGSELMLLSE